MTTWHLQQRDGEFVGLHGNLIALALQNPAYEDEADDPDFDMFKHDDDDDYGDFSETSKAEDKSVQENLVISEAIKRTPLLPEMYYSFRNRDGREDESNANFEITSEGCASPIPFAHMMNSPASPIPFALLGVNGAVDYVGGTSDDQSSPGSSLGVVPSPGVSPGSGEYLQVTSDDNDGQFLPSF